MARPPDLRMLTLEARRGLYATRNSLTLEIQKQTGLRLGIPVYFKDPIVAASMPGPDLDEDFSVPWEPGLGDGPTSARFAVVDYDSTTGKLETPAKWEAAENCFMAPNGVRLTADAKHLPQFRQVSVWATVQHTLEFFESAFGLGRRIDWGFDGNRLIVVPTAGHGENAFYDRESKSLQFYWFERDGKRINTCESADIVNHELGHAILDGLRPHMMESVLPQTAGFHEFLGDLVAIIMAFRNNDFRRAMIKESDGDLATGELLPSLARQFGEAVTGQPYLRTALNDMTMSDVANNLSPHDVSQVLTGTMFDIMVSLLGKYREREEERAKADAFYQRQSDAELFWNVIQRMQMSAVQPLDFLPPCDITFRDYALAVLRAELVSNPTDPARYRDMMFEAFRKRGILDDVDGLMLGPASVFDRLRTAIYHSVDSISASRGGAYRFLDDNRRELFIPDDVDVVVTGLARASKLTTQSRRQPEQVVVQYIWREDVVLDGGRFGRYSGQTTQMLCGGTIVLDENGNVVHWARKPGTSPLASRKADILEQRDGKARLGAFLDVLARRIRAGEIGALAGNSLGLLERSVPPFTTREVAGTIRFELSPHIRIQHDHHDDVGGRQWQASS